MKYYKGIAIGLLNIFLLTGCRYFGPCSNLTISVEKTVMTVGETQTLLFTTNCDDGIPVVDVYINDTSILGFDDATFTIVALATGETYINAQLEDYPTYSNSLTITVVQNQ
ncbi:MAG: hypothetical protein WC201_00755 [Bacilli bacterium]